MRGETDRDCRARGGSVMGRNPGQAVDQESRKNVKREFRGHHPHGTPDATLKRGAGPIFRKRGGKVADNLADGDRDERAEGGAVAGRKRGGKVAGGFKKPHLGRAGRARGGGVGSDLKPLTSAAHPNKPKDRRIMPDSEKTP
jgi:hypothetical protein